MGLPPEQIAKVEIVIEKDTALKKINKNSFLIHFETLIASVDNVQKAKHTIKIAQPNSILIGINIPTIKPCKAITHPPRFNSFFPNQVKVIKKMIIPALRRIL